MLKCNSIYIYIFVFKLKLFNNSDKKIKRKNCFILSLQLLVQNYKCYILVYCILEKYANIFVIRIYIVINRMI